VIKRPFAASLADALPAREFEVDRIEIQHSWLGGTQCCKLKAMYPSAEINVTVENSLGAVILNPICEAFVCMPSALSALESSADSCIFDKVGFSFLNIG
jgi:hypothetical protein